jgi:hypothetical protein
VIADWINNWHDAFEGVLLLSVAFGLACMAYGSTRRIK